MSKTAASSYYQKRRRETNRAAFFFLLPAALVYLCFIGGPVLISLVLSFTEYSILKSAEFVGLSNYQAIFSDFRMPTIVVNTIT